MCINTHNMFEKISEKDIISINQQFDKGNIINKNSLSFALFHANKSLSWLRSCAFLVRAVLIDHVFEEGNKCTAAAIIAGFFEEKNIAYNPEEVSRLVIKILKNNITNINNIEREIKNAIIQ